MYICQLGFLFLIFVMFFGHVLYFLSFFLYTNNLRRLSFISEPAAWLSCDGYEWSVKKFMFYSRADASEWTQSPNNSHLCFLFCVQKGSVKNVSALLEINK